MTRTQTYFIRASNLRALFLGVATMAGMTSWRKPRNWGLPPREVRNYLYVYIDVIYTYMDSDAGTAATGVPGREGVPSTQHSTELPHLPEARDIRTDRDYEPVRTSRCANWSELHIIPTQHGKE